MSNVSRGVNQIALLLLAVPFLGFANSQRSDFLELLSIATAAAGLTLFTIIWLAARSCYNRPYWLARAFGPLMSFVWFATSGLIVLQAAVALYSLVMRQGGFDHIDWLGSYFSLFAGYGTALLSFGFLLQTIGAMLHLRGPVETHVVGMPISAQDQDRLWNFVREIALRLDARPPDHIVLGLPPLFFSTAATVLVGPPKGRLEGQTLYLPLSLLRLLSRAELTAMIGHELSHFRREDVACTMRFVPAHQKLIRRLHSMQEARGPSTLVMFPVHVVLMFALLRFDRVHRALILKRENQADRLGASLEGANALITGLIKMRTAGPVWDRTVDSTIEAINQLESVGNLAPLFCDGCLTVLDESEGVEFTDKIRDWCQPHPTDIHPTLMDRAATLGIFLNVMPIGRVPEELMAVGLIDDIERYETALSEQFRQALIDEKRARPPSTTKRQTGYQMKRASLASRAAARRRDLDAVNARKEPEAIE